jgi:hypothetical protein
LVTASVDIKPRAGARKEAWIEFNRAKAKISKGSNVFGAQVPIFVTYIRDLRSTYGAHYSFYISLLLSFLFLLSSYTYFSCLDITSKCLRRKGPAESNASTAGALQGQSPTIIISAPHPTPPSDSWYLLLKDPQELTIMKGMDSVAIEIHDPEMIKLPYHFPVERVHPIVSM